MLDTLIGYTITRGWRSERERAEREYAHSAQLCSVMARGTYTILKVRKRRKLNMTSKKMIRTLISSPYFLVNGIYLKKFNVGDRASFSLMLNGFLVGKKHVEQSDIAS